jgi:AraC-like DNA-binding protein
MDQPPLLIHMPQRKQLRRHLQVTEPINLLRHRESRHMAERELRQPFSIKLIAQETNMSPSGLHHHFKTLTNMPPLQYQKHLRLQEARRLMLVEAMDASAAAYHVGYVSRSQFTREYRRLFGASSFRDVEQIRQRP